MKHSRAAWQQVTVTILLAVGVLGAVPAVAQFARPPSPEQIAAAEVLPTPRGANGKPDLTGYWGTPLEFGSGKNVVSADGKKIEFQITPPFAASRVGAPRGAGRAAAGAAGGEPAPTYKPELLARVKELALTEVDTDPSFVCNPPGLPRAGVPTEIFQSRDAVVFLYETRTDYRVIPTDGRAHDPNLDPTWYGDSVGRWEGDTLVIDSVNFTDESWLGSGGYFHTEAMHVIERVTRHGNTLRYEVTVEDPDVLTKPWVMPPRTVVLGKAGFHAMEELPCHDTDRPHMVDKYHITP